MLRTFRWIALTVLCVSPMVVSFGQISPRRAPRMKHLRQPVAQKSVVLPVMPSGPLPQVPMKDLPATQPQVSYESGLLTIMAENSTLGDILREVHKQSGATIDVPANATERVVTRLGPGPARDVLASLLNGSAFNYVMVGTAADPSSLAKVILTTKPAGGGVTEAAYQPQPQQYIPQQVVPGPGMGPGGPVAQQAQSDDDSDSAEDAEDNADQDQEQEQTNGAAANGDGSQQPNAGPKTPEQILEMLRQRQQQQGAPGQQPFPRFNQNLQQPPPPQQDDNQ